MWGLPLSVEWVMNAGRLKTRAGHAVLAAIALCIGAAPLAAQGAGDLLVAPTRLELEGFRGTEVVLNNVGTERATYRISLELRRMTPDGQLEEVDPAKASAAETAALDMIAYAPRRVTLEPNQPQSIRVGVRPPEGLPDGEYRVHMLFRAIPEPQPATQNSPAPDGISIELRPIYGVTIPVIVRAGKLAAEATIAGVRLINQEGREGLSLDLTRSGNRSLYGDIRVVKPGSSPVVVGRGIAIYPEVDRRTVSLPVPPEVTASLAGPATVQYVERTSEGTGRVLAEAEVVLR
jgi:P pilus assembly chaperone PapD